MLQKPQKFCNYFNKNAYLFGIANLLFISKDKKKLYKCTSHLLKTEFQINFPFIAYICPLRLNTVSIAFAQFKRSDTIETIEGDLHSNISKNQNKLKPSNESKGSNTTADQGCRVNLESKNLEKNASLEQLCSQISRSLGITAARLECDLHPQNSQPVFLNNEALHRK